MRDRARARVAVHFAAWSGSRGRESCEKACHPAWAVIGGRVYSSKSGSRESKDVKPSDNELGFFSCQEIVDYCLDFLSGTYRKTPEISREALALSMPDRVRMAVRDFLRERYEPSAADHDSSTRR